MRFMAVAQGLFYVISGVWPIVSLRTFEKVTGPKHDDWLVKTVGLLIAATGAVLLDSARADRRTPELAHASALLGASNALILGGVSLIYSSLGRIPRIYRADAAAEAAIAVGWWSALRRARRAA